MKYDKAIDMINSSDFEMRDLGLQILYQKATWTYYEYLHIWLGCNHKDFRHKKFLEDIRRKNQESWNRNSKTSLF